VADWADREHVRLFISGAARRIWYLRAELRLPDTTAERASGIQQELDDMPSWQLRGRTTRSIRPPQAGSIRFDRLGNRQFGVFVISRALLILLIGR
jgi:hypothetical protein